MPQGSSQPASVATTASPPATIVMPIVPTELQIPELVRGSQPANLRYVLKHGIPVAPKPSSLQFDPHLGRKVPMYGTPDDLLSATWWSADQHGTPAPKPGGKPGNMNIALFFVHTGINGAQGVGNNFGKLRKGEKFMLYGQNASGHKVRFTLVVVRVHAGIDKSDPNALNDSIVQAPPSTRVALFTCSGSVDEAISSSNFNTEVDAAIVAVTAVGK